MDANHATDESVCLRTAKSCGPDAPTLASSSREASFSGATVANKPGHRGEREISRKTIARGMPDVSGVTVVTNACAFYHCTRGCGRAERPAFPAPSELRGRNEQAKPRAKSAARSRSCVWDGDVDANPHPSCPGLTRASINLRIAPFSKKMDCRVEPGNDGVN